MGRTAAILLAAGSGSRMAGAVADKVLAPLAGRPVFAHSAAAFLASLRLFSGQQDAILGVALAMAAGAFLCIAAADLLPEVQFHSHDRVLLTASLALGLTIAWGITVLERSSHAHARHGVAAPAAGQPH